jgi:ammonia channel protein AmtB
MTPGLGFFYGGMVGKKNVISTMPQEFYGNDYRDTIMGICWF